MAPTEEDLVVGTSAAQPSGRLSRNAALCLMALAGPCILFSFQLFFRSDSYQYWGDKYHAVLSAQYLYAQQSPSLFTGPLWRDDVLNGNIWLVYLPTAPFTPDNLIARLFGLSPFGVDLISHGLAYSVVVGPMYLYLRRALSLTRESAVATALMFASSGYLLSVWTGSANDFASTGALPALLLCSHLIRESVEGERRGSVLLPWVGLSLVSYLFAGVATVKTWPIILLLTGAYVLIVFGLGRTVVWVGSALTVGLLLFSPWLWLFLDAARISQRLMAGFSPPAPPDLSQLLTQWLVIAKRVGSGFNIYGLVMPVALAGGIFLAEQQSLRAESPLIRRVVGFSAVAFCLCLATEAMAAQINGAKASVPYINGYDVIRFGWFASFFVLTISGLMLDRILAGVRTGAFGSAAVARRRRIVIGLIGMLFAVQAAHFGYRLWQAPTEIHPQHLLLHLWLGLYVGGSSLLLWIMYRRYATVDGRGLARSPLTSPAWCNIIISLTVLFETSMLAYRFGVDTATRVPGSEPIMTYAERFAVPGDLALAKEINVTGDRVLDLTRPYDSVLTEASVTALPLAGLPTSLGYSNLYPRWYHRFVAEGVNGARGAPSRLLEIRGGSATNWDMVKLLGVKYVVAHDGAHIPGYQPFLRHDLMGKTVYVADQAMGPAFRSGRIRCLENDDAALAFMRTADYQTLLDRTVLVVSDLAAGAACRDGVLTAEGLSSPPVPLNVLRGQDWARLEVQAPSGGVVTLTDTYYPGWHAFVDGGEVPILRAYTAFRAVVVGPGRHTVEFVFAPGTFLALQALSKGLFGLLLAATFWHMARGRWNRLSVGSSRCASLGHRV